MLSKECPFYLCSVTQIKQYNLFLFVALHRMQINVEFDFCWSSTSVTGYSNCAYTKHGLKAAGLVQLGVVPPWSSALPDHRSIYSSHLASWAVCELSAAAIALLVMLRVKTNSCVRSSHSNDKSLLTSTEGRAGKRICLSGQWRNKRWFHFKASLAKFSNTMVSTNEV